MKLFTSIFALLVISSLVGFGYYNRSSSHVIDYAEIQITSPADSVGKIYLSTKDPINDGEEKILKTGIKKNGAEITRIKCNSPTIIYITYKNVVYPIYVDMGSTTHATINNENNKITFNYSGSYSDINKYLAKKKDILDSFAPKQLRDLYAMSPEKFNLFNENINSEISTLRKKHLLSDTIDYRFKKYDLADVSALFLIRKANYSDYHYYFTKEKTPVQYYISNLPKDISLDNQYGLLSKNYTDLLSKYTSHLIKQSKKNEITGIKEDQLFFFNKKFLLATSLFKNSEVSQFLTSQVLLGLLDLGFDSAYKEKVKTVKTTFHDSKYLKIAIEKYSALKKIGEGKRAPLIDMMDTNKSKITLEQFKGKNIFINVWSPACHNSVEELENINKIADQFKKGDKIIFLNLYYDNNLNDLLEQLKSNPIGGTNAILANNISEFTDDYFINTVPRYILIDTTGAIISPFAERPSSPLLIQKLKELVKNSSAL